MSNLAAVTAFSIHPGARGSHFMRTSAERTGGATALFGPVASGAYATVPALQAWSGSSGRYAPAPRRVARAVTWFQRDDPGAPLHSVKVSAGASAILVEPARGTFHYSVTGCAAPTSRASRYVGSRPGKSAVPGACFCDTTPAGDVMADDKRSDNLAYRERKFEPVEERFMRNSEFSPLRVNRMSRRRT